MKDLKNQHVSCPYEVGDGFFTKNSTNPEARWPGTKWTQIKDMFILAAGDNYEVDATGGEESHILSETEMPNHSHTQTKEMPNKGIAHVVRQFVDGGYNGDTYGAQTTWLNGKAALNTAAAGGGQPHNNMPPYLVRYYWERTA